MSQELLSAYLVVGADELKAKEVVARLRRRLEAGLEVFNLDEYASAADREPGELLASLNTLPVGSGFRLVIIHEAEKLPKATSEAIVSYLADPNPGCVLCLVAERLAKTTRLHKAVAKVGARAVIDCTPAKRWDLPKRVMRMAQVRGMRMDEDAAGELIARVGESTTLLDQHTSTLSELCRTTGGITREDVARYVTRTAEVKPWDFLDAVCQRDAARALELYQLMQGTSEVALVAMLVGRLRELVCAASLSKRGQSAELARTLGKQQWQVKNHLTWAGRFSEPQLSGALAACAACDRALKSGADPRTELVTLVLGICGESNPGTGVREGAMSAATGA